MRTAWSASTPQSGAFTQCRISPLCFHLSTNGGQIGGRHGAVAASRCRYPAIRGCSTRSTRSCRFRRTFSRAVRVEPSSSSRAGRGILNYLTQRCNSSLILVLRHNRGAFQVRAALLPTPPRYLLIPPARRSQMAAADGPVGESPLPTPCWKGTVETFGFRRNWNTC